VPQDWALCKWLPTEEGWREQAQSIPEGACQSHQCGEDLWWA
jgi:hypothetical protein